MSNTVYGNLSNQFPTTPPFTGTLNTDIGSLNANLSALQDKSNVVLTQQEKIKKIVDAESTRLQQKKQGVDSAYSSQVRATYVNDNMQKRYNAYLYILFVVVIVLIIVFFLSMMGNYFPIIPPLLLNIIYVFLFSFTIIYSISIYSEIQKHDPMNYDRLKLRKPVTAGNSVDISDNSMNSLGLGTGEYGECPIGYSSVNGKCENFSGNNELQSLNAFEFTDYSRY